MTLDRQGQPHHMTGIFERIMESEPRVKINLASSHENVHLFILSRQ